MFKVFGALSGKGSSSPNGSSTRESINERRTKLILKEANDFEIALQAMDYVLDDRTEEGLALLKENEKVNGQDQTITVLAKGVIEFLQATLSFEMDEIKNASVTLGKAEQLSWKSRTEAQKSGLRNSSIYPPGTVYAVTYTESCLLHALLMLFTESMMDAAKALLKLRKAYSMLHEIMEVVKKSELSRKVSGSSAISVESNGSFISEDGKFVSADIPYKLSDKESNDPELWAFAEKIYKMRKMRLSGSHIGNTPAISRLRSGLGLSASNKPTPENSSTDLSALSDEVAERQATIDEFIHSGVNLCYGILQVVLSLIPPAIGAVLSIVGFRGSREEGLRLIWKATKDRNVHGCIGLLALMFYYDGPFQFTDVDFDIPAATTNTTKSSDSDSEGESTISIDEMDGHMLLHPGHILEESLLHARALFPNSALWLLNEARMLSSRGRLQEAVELLDSIDIETIHMRQVKGLLVFDRAITLSHMQQYERAAEDLLSLLKISDWSHAFYTYFAGCCYLENYRMAKAGIIPDDKIEFYRNKAEELIFGAPKLLGKKTFKSKNLPLDRLMIRKVEQFKSTQKKLGLKDPLEAIATSPVREIAYFYNGYNRMCKKDLEIAQKMLTEYHNPAIDQNDPDQELVKNILVSLTLRRLGNVNEGAKLLDQKVLPSIYYMQNGKVKYIKKTEDPWAYPTALYERALFTWKLDGMDNLAECKNWLVIAQNYASDYELSTRVGMKIKAALDRVEEALN
ncbi:Iml2p [Nakaseomyces bracarensis]|uniref:Iml2p n=1 Tax=Nakaseomyces bracarensis TaxID=273131 RepID=UPI003871DDF2